MVQVRQDCLNCSFQLESGSGFGSVCGCDCRTCLPDGSTRVTSVCTVALTSDRPTVTPTVLSWIWLMKVTVPFWSTDTSGGVRSRTYTVTAGSAAALGAKATSPPTRARQ